MATLSIPNTFVNGTPADATKVNQNFTDTAAQVNNIENANVGAAAAIVESKVAFSGTGHGHTGGTDGKVLGATAVPLAVNNGAQGTMLFKSGTTAAIAFGGYLDITFTGTAFSQSPIIQIERAENNSVQNHYIAYEGESVVSAAPNSRDPDTHTHNVNVAGAGTSDTLHHTNRGTSITNVAASGFRLNNNHVNNATFRWTAIGI